MKILVVSDTHRDTNKVINILHSIGDITNVVHLGDMVRDADEIQEVFPEKTYHKIQGNNDMLSFAKSEMLLCLCGHNIFATHGHAYGVRGGVSLLAKRASQIGCDIALFGHTHERYSSYIAPDDEEKRGALYVMNPGSIERPRDFLPPSYGIIDITKSGIMTNIVDVPGL